MDLHQTLLERGYEIPADELTGNVAGPGTVAAVRAFQTAHGGLVVDGIAGPKTRAALADASRLMIARD